MTSTQQRAAIAAGIALVAMSLLKRSRLVRVAVVAAGALAGYAKLVDREPDWHDVSRPDA